MYNKLVVTSLFDFGGKSPINANGRVSAFLCTNICLGSKIFALVAQQSEPQIAPPGLQHKQLIVMENINKFR